MKRYYVRFALLLLLSDSATLQAQHSLWTWGNNDYGVLGDGYWTPADGGTHTAVPGVVSCFDDWIAVSAGQERCSAIRLDGSLWEWGVGIYMGIPISEVEYQSPYFTQTVPMQIGTDHDWVSLCTSGDVTFARKADGSIWGWGNKRFPIVLLAATSRSVRPSRSLTPPLMSPPTRLYGSWKVTTAPLPRALVTPEPLRLPTKAPLFSSL